MVREGRPFVVKWAEADTEKALRAAYRLERDGAIRPRLQALWLLRSGGRHLDEVATVVGVHYRSVQRWVAWYRAGGLEAVRTHRLGGPGKAPWLTPEQQEAVAQEIATGRFHRAADIRDWIAATYQVRYSEGGMESLLKRLRCAPKVPRPLHTHADPEAQEAWKKGGSGQRSETQE